MKSAVLLIASFLFFTKTASADSFEWTVLSIEGKGVKCGASPIKVGKNIVGGCALQTGETSKVTLVNNSGVLLAVAPLTEIQLGAVTPAAATHPATAAVMRGTARWIFKKDDPNSKNFEVGAGNALIKSPSGAQVVVSVADSPDETFVVLLDGKVEVRNKGDVKDIVTMEGKKTAALSNKPGALIRREVSLENKLTALVESTRSAGEAKGSPRTEYFGEAVPKKF